MLRSPYCCEVMSVWLRRRKNYFSWSRSKRLRILLLNKARRKEKSLEGFPWARARPMMIRWKPLDKTNSMNRPNKERMSCMNKNKKKAHERNSLLNNRIRKYLFEMCRYGMSDKKVCCIFPSARMKEPNFKRRSMLNCWKIALINNLLFT